MRMPSWNTLRVPTAFIVAPLACPLIFILYGVIAGSTLTDPLAAGAFRAYAIVSLIGVYLFVGTVGVLIYRLMCEHNLTSFWLAPLVGYIGGAVSFFLFGMPRPFDPWITELALTAYGPIGAVVCAIIWLIARPDRRSHDAKGGNTASDP